MMDEGKQYYYRLITLVVDLGTDVLLKYFNTQIPTGQTVSSFLKNEKSTIQKLKKKKVFTDMQLNILNATNLDESKFDISLLYTLLRNLTNIQEPSGGWTIACPAPFDTTPGALLMRLKMVRNEAIAHRPKSSMEKSEFEKFWKEAEESLVNLAGEISPDEESAVRQKVIEVKTKHLVGDEKLKVDKLMKWEFEEKFSGIASKLDNINDKFDKQGNLTEDVSSMKSSIEEIQKQLKGLGIQESSADAPSPQVLAISTSGEHVNEDLTLKHQVDQMRKQMDQFMKRMESLFYAPGMIADANDPEEPPIDNKNALSKDEIEKYARELGSDWEIFAIYLGYRQVQVDALKETYAGKIEVLHQVMLEKWHNVVARCNENPKRLLAAAFSGIKDNLTASNILEIRDLLPEVKKLKPQKDTAEKIKNIRFSRPVVYAVQPTVNHNYYGGHNSINNFPGSSSQISGDINFHDPNRMQFFPPSMGQGSAHGQNIGFAGPYNIGSEQAYLPSTQVSPHTMGLEGANGPNTQALSYNMGTGGTCGPYMQGLGHTTPTICRGKRDEDQIDGTPSNLFKRNEDSTLPQSTVAMLHECMKSVGHLTTCPRITSGTVFRVGDRHVITALHVITPIKNEWYSMSSDQSSPGHIIPAVFVNFNEDPHIPPQTLYKLRPPCFIDLDLDIAILEIHDPNPSLPRPLPLSKTDGPKSHVSCIGYGHPGSTLKHLDPKCGVLTVNSEKVTQSVNMLLTEKQSIMDGLRRNGKNPDLVHTAFKGYDDPSCFIVDSYFEHGGSGAPAIDHSRPFSLQVVGIYTRGFPSFFFDLPIDMQERYRSEYRFEMCTRMSSVYSVLMTYNDALAQQIFG